MNKIQIIKNAASLKALMIVFALTNADAAYSGMSGGEFAAIQGGFNQATNSFNQMMTNEITGKWTQVGVSDSLNGAKATADGNVLKEQAFSQAEKYGGAYGKTAANAISDCFNFDLPSLNLGAGFGLPNFCGMDALMGSPLGNMMKGKATTIQPLANNNNQVENKVDTPKGVATQPKSDNAKKNCTVGVNKDCAEKLKSAAIEERKSGVGKGGSSSTLAVKQEAQIIAYDEETEKNICSDNEWNDGTTKSYACRKDVVDDVITYDDYKNGLLTGDSKLLDATEKEVRANMVETNEKIAIDSTNRVNLSREIRDEYNLKYNPSVLAIEDVTNMKEESYYTRNKDNLTKDPSLYIVPVVDSENKQFSFAKFGIEKYKEAITSFNNLQITDVNNKPIESKEQVKANLERLGGITPFSSSLYGYEASLAAMANDIYGKDGEQGDVGRQMAILNGLKGNMYQSVMINQQLENKARSDYNINIKQFTKLSQSIDAMNNKLEQMENQNAAILSVLKEISYSLKKIENK